MQHAIHCAPDVSFYVGIFVLNFYNEIYHGERIVLLVLSLSKLIQESSFLRFSANNNMGFFLHFLWKSGVTEVSNNYFSLLK